MMEPADGPPVATRQLAIRFTGSGSAYFRIWIVNLVLVLVTFTLYYPWAKVRRLRYFHGHTLVDGTPLGFHGDPRKMFRGYVLVGLMLALVALAGQYTPVAGLMALVVVAVIAPALLRAAWRFRLANSSWRGMRFAFSGSVHGAYRALIPVFVPALLCTGALTLATGTAEPPIGYVYMLAAVLLVSLATAPWLTWNLKRYQHGNYGLASLQTGFKATTGAFYVLAFQCLGVTLLTLGLVAAMAAASLFTVQSGLFTGLYPPQRYLVPWMMLGLFATYVAVRSVARAGLQNLVWTKTGNRSMRFISQLHLSRFFLLTVKNWALVLLTLGLYWPFAVVATTRMRLEAVVIKTRQDPATLVSLLQASDVEAADDATGGLMDVDIGL